MRLIPLLLLTAVAALAGAGCERVGEVDYAQYADAAISFSFGASAPYWGDLDTSLLRGLPTVEVWGLPLRNASSVAIASAASTALWDRDLMYTVEVSHFDGSWVLGRYKCNDTYGYIYFFYKVEQEPSTRTATFTFTVPRDKAYFADSRMLRVAVPPQHYYSPVCSDVYYYCPFTDYCYPVCAPYSKENTATASGPGWWYALMVNGVPAGGEYSAYGITVKMPNPWAYSGTISLTTDLGGAFLSSVNIRALGEPADWGEIVFKPPKPVPLYISRVVKLPTQDWQSLTSPPDSFLISMAGNATWKGEQWAWEFTLASIAYKTSFWLRPYVVVRDLINHEVRLRAPYGSVIRADVAVVWFLDAEGRRAWVASYPTSLRIADSDGNILDYEELGKRRKLAFAIDSAYSGPPKGINPASVATGIDSSTPVVETAWYSHPYPCSQWPVIYRCVYAQHVYTKANGTWVGYSRVGPQGGGWPMNKIVLVDFLSLNNWFLGGAGDVMKLLWGDPVLYFWHTYRIRSWAFNPQTGDWDIEGSVTLSPPHAASLVYEVYGHEQYKKTTRSPSPTDKLYHAAAGPAWAPEGLQDVLDVSAAPGFADVTPLGASTIVSDLGPFLISLIPTTACRGPMCLRVDEELWGPAPPPTPDLALPGAGYSFMFTWLGKPAYADVKIYVEMGYVVQPDGTRREVSDYLLAEISREWRPLDSVFVGPGWWISYLPLGPCEALGLGSKAVYVTPHGWVGPVKILVEINNTRYEGAFVVSDDVSLVANTTTPAPDVLTSPGLVQTVSFFLNGAPYFHGLYGLGEGGRQYPFTCTSTRIAAKTQYGRDVWADASQLTVSGDFWGFIQLWGVVKVEDAYSRPVFEVVDWSRGLVKITADSPVVGFAFYQQRNGGWIKVGEVAGDVPFPVRCVVVNASKIFPWDPVRVLPLVSQSVKARIGDTITLWRPADRLLFKTWADDVGYPKGARSELQIVGTC
ncbi:MULTISPECIES: hypothetical protein [Pyrobaculum]|uniref:Uncharacterized protein n=2 Tax=Pyrobaculum arsenaticum TaxID=121277 RepID=A4WKW7_PYRAR|nr:hypothetical protein [Pyrobaculum arsenaticum]ABP51034.1 conserved hypothetical protein [Pyrobaculum arsenaticum DSM 13514]NYR15241.1 hypothetical protein [Pyrobaculum arsenaticum]